MAWRKHREPGPAPGWVDAFDPGAWPDDMTWLAARNEWLAAHPAHLDAIIASLGIPVWTVADGGVA